MGLTFDITTVPKRTRAPGLLEMVRILVVEDDPFTAGRLRRLLIARGVCQVILATTVAQALALLDPPPDWVILDMELPDGTGLTVLETIRNAGLPTGVVVSSATRDANLIAAFTAHQPDAVLPKPLDPALLPF
jgi:CheY-like chemotaxis protein